jgi:hypothetical protein
MPSDLRAIFPTAFTNDIFLEIAMNNIPGMDVVRKFFDNPDFDGTERDVWDYGGTVSSYNYTADTGADYYIASNNAGDTQDTLIYILDEYKDAYAIIVKLQGQTPVKVNDLNNIFFSASKRVTPFKITRVWRVNNASYNPGVPFAGQVFVTEGNNFVGGVPQITDDVRAYVNDGNNSTLMSHYTVPNGHHALFYVGYMSITKKTSESSEIKVWSRDEGGVFILQEKLDTNSTGSGNTERFYNPPIFITPKTDLKFSGDATGACGVSGSYNLVVVKSEFVDKAVDALQAQATQK